MNESDKTAAEIESLRAEVSKLDDENESLRAEVSKLDYENARLRRSLRELAAATRRDVDAQPGTIVLTEPVALIDWIAALLSDGDTKATHEGARRRTQRILDTIKGGSFGSFGLLAPTLVPVADGGAT